MNHIFLGSLICLLRFDRANDGRQIIYRVFRYRKISIKNLTTKTPLLAQENEVWGVLYLFRVISRAPSAALYEISCYHWSCYNERIDRKIWVTERVYPLTPERSGCDSATYTFISVPLSSYYTYCNKNLSACWNKMLPGECKKLYLWRVNIGSGNCLAPSHKKASTWTSVDQNRRHYVASPGHKGSKHVYKSRMKTPIIMLIMMF